MAKRVSPALTFALDVSNQLERGSQSPVRVAFPSCQVFDASRTQLTSRQCLVAVTSGLRHHHNPTHQSVSNSAVNCTAATVRIAGAVMQRAHLTRRARARIQGSTLLT